MQSLRKYAMKIQSFLGVKLYKRDALKKRDEDRRIQAALKQR